MKIRKAMRIARRRALRISIPGVLLVTTGEKTPRLLFIPGRI
ncbi:hypothetical protein [Alistipes sp.]